MIRVAYIGIIVFVLFLSGCKEEAGIDYMTNQKAFEYFQKVEKFCSNEKALLWGDNLYGPIIIVNPYSREIYSNHQDSEGLLKPRDGIFVGTYPKEKLISNIPVEFGGTQYGMVRLRRRGGEDPYYIETSCIHSLFHCYQLNKNIDTPDYYTSHFSEKTARLWVKLEWKALQRGLRTSGETRVQAIRDALVFRSARREMYPQFIGDENNFENYEGLSTFTYTFVRSETHDEYVRQLLNIYDRIYSFTNYDHAWGYLTGALYAHLLNESGFEFSTINSRDLDLGKLVGEKYNIILPEISRDIAGSLAFSYDIDHINSEEQERETIIKEDIRKRVAKYTERPVIFLELESPNFSYEPDDMDIIDTIGIIYNTLRISDNWGKMSVDNGGCLVSPNLDFIRVPAKNIKEDRNHITGEGWQIILNDSWEMVPFDDNFIIRKLIP